MMFIEPDGKYIECFLGTVLPDFESAINHPKEALYLDALYRKWGSGDLLALLGEVWYIASREYRIGAAPESEKEYFYREAMIFFQRLIEQEVPASCHPGAREFWLQAVEGAKKIADFSEFIEKSNPIYGWRFMQLTDGKLQGISLDQLRKPEDFYSFYGVRAAFEQSMREFAEGKSNVPLLISGLPGHGKTQLTLSYAAARAELSILLPPPGYLEKGLAELFGILGEHKERKFVLFFDDIDPQDVDFFEFRNQVGGVYSPPENVLLCISSNYDFPPSILSRGRSVKFPLFDEIRCLEMVEDYLKTHHLKKPSANLVSLIASAYTEEFGQKKFSELSPRTLVRYLTVYDRDQSKRRLMLELSNGEVITRPDAQLFYEFNIKILRQLYGDGYIEQLKQEKLKDLADGV